MTAISPIIPPPPPRPVGKWERLGVAAKRTGLSADLLRSELTAGRVEIRSARVGARGMVLVAGADVDAFAHLLAQGALA